MTDFNTLFQNVEGAAAEYVAARTALAAATAKHDTSLAALSTHQKAFDDAVSSFRNSAPHDPGSYWGSNAQKPVA